MHGREGSYVLNMREREVCLLKGIAEGTYKTKHAEAAKLYYTIIYPHTQTQTQTCTGLYGGRQASSLRDITRTKRNQRLLLPRLRKLRRGGDPGAESGDQGWSDAREAGWRAPVIVILAGVDERRGSRAVRGRRGRARQQLVFFSRRYSRLGGKLPLHIPVANRKNFSLSSKRQQSHSCTSESKTRCRIT